MFSAKIFLILLPITLCLTACAAPGSTVGTFASATSALAVTTPPSPASETPTPRPSATLLPPSATPVIGQTTYKINVRAGPGAGYASLGLLDANQEVQIVGRDESGKWYLILYPASPDGHGWVSAEYVQTENANTLSVAITATAQETPSGMAGKVMQRLNVRSGPGTNFSILGILEPDTVISLTGKNQNGIWLQIEYPGGPDERGWVMAAYIQADNIAALPVLDDYGNPVTPGTAGPSALPMTPTPTVGPAHADNDSAAIPAVRVIFSPAGTRQLIYSSDVSAPEGDNEDWVEFTPYAAAGTLGRVTMSLTCTGNGALDVELWQGGTPLAGWGELACNAPAITVELTSGQAYLLRLSPATGNGLRYVYYTLVIENGAYP